MVSTTMVCIAAAAHAAAQGKALARVRGLGLGTGYYGLGPGSVRGPGSSTASCRPAVTEGVSLGRPLAEEVVPSIAQHPRAILIALPPFDACYPHRLVV